MAEFPPGTPASPDLVTVVMPIYNSGSGMSRNLSLAIISVLAQTHHNLELIIIDDGFTDDYTAIRAEFEVDPCLTWLAQPNQANPPPTISAPATATANGSPSSTTMTLGTRTG